jgi:putative phosphoesterase
VSTKIGLLSDVHATPAPVKEALSIFKEEGVEMILCPGDIAGYGNQLDKTVELLIAGNCKAILGNHEIWHLDNTAKGKKDRASSFFSTLPAVIELTIEGKKLYMVHASPPRSYVDGIKLLNDDGNILLDQRLKWSERLIDFEHDVLVVGHTHQVFAERLGGTLVINSGSTKFNHTCAILHFPDLEIRWFALSNKSPEKVWNWGKNQINPIS